MRHRLSLPRAADVTDRQAALAFSARFFDEFLGGMPDVLMPTIQRQLGLSLTQVALLAQVLNYVALVVEPVNGLLLDLWPRKWMMGLGALGVALAVILIGVAPTFALLLVAYALYGASTGPLAHSADVVLVEAYPTAPDRAYARATLIDTVGALLGPLLVSLAFLVDVSWRRLLVGSGLLTFVYGGLILATGFPPPLHGRDGETAGLYHALRQNVRTVLADGDARHWLLFLFLFGILETPFVLKTIWLATVVGMTQQQIGVYVALEMLAGIAGLVVLDRWRRRAAASAILRIVIAGVALLFPAWLLIPGVIPRFLLMAPLSFLLAMLWPIAKAGALASVPGRAGAVQAISSL
ncbi:MAG: MFS transporter, partial [Caldilineaceae bacterium]|nr:MFS transporter [Caldilineaceae bacterium]